MRDRTAMTVDYLHSILDYNPDTGWTTWLVRRNHVKAGTRAGCESTDSSGKPYRTLRIDGLKYSEHRLAFFIMTGRWPDPEVDHIDGNGCNNAWRNLREADETTNRRNQRRLKTNTSGHTGVYWHARNLKWEARIGVGGKLINLGYFDSIADAINARCAANDKYNFHKNHGSDRPL